MAERISGRATAEGTAAVAKRVGAAAVELPGLGLTVGPMGFGGYRVRHDSPVHRRALGESLRRGLNLIDTSTNYGDGSSEKMVGEVLADAVRHGDVTREGVVVVTKIGYAQGRVLQRMRRRPYPDTVVYRDDCWHCIHPKFLADRLDESQGRLGLDHVDVLLLHNPEYFFSDRLGRTGRVTATDRETFDDRIRRAFEKMESFVKAGRIGAYGVSSNTFVVPGDAAESTSVARMLELAHEVGGEGHHFRVIQLPMNLLESGAAAVASEPGERTPLEVARAAGLTVLANRPLNAINGAGRLVRLAGAAGPRGRGRTDDLSEVLRAVLKLEAQWAAGLGRRLRLGEGGAEDLFRWGRELAARREQIEDLESWHRLRHEVIAPHLGRTSAELLRVLEGDVRREFGTWWEAYGTRLHDLFVAFEAELGARREDRVAALSGRLDPLLPERWRSRLLSEKAVGVVRGLGADVVLVGMRQPAYVHEMVELCQAPGELLGSPPAVDPRALAAEFADM